MALAKTLENLVHAGPVFRDALRSGADGRVLRSLLGPAWRGFVEQRAKQDGGRTIVRSRNAVDFDWHYIRDMPEMTRLYEAAKRSQWNATADIDWSASFDPGPAGAWLLPDEFLPVSDMAVWRRIPPTVQAEHRLGILAWLLSQFLHGEQGALMAAAQVMESVPWMDAKLYGATQVVDEGRHVEVFHTYLDRRLGKRYDINDNLYVVIDSLMLNEAWDMKFLGMQILIEGLALGAFSTIRHATREPLLREVLRYVITDEARHVHFGVLALGKFYEDGLTDSERRYREDWALEVAVQLRNRFLAHEFYEEYYGHVMSRREWDRMAVASPLMHLFRRTMFKRIMPNLRRLGLVGPRVERHYRELGLLDLAEGKTAPELTAEDLLEDGRAETSHASAPESDGERAAN